MWLMRKAVACLPALILAGLPLALGAQEAEPEVLASDVLFTVNNTWMLVSAFLVFIMHLGFSCIEVGLTQAKNTANILFKNMAIVAIGLLTYAVVGFNLMYPGFADAASGFFGFAGFGLATDEAGMTAAYNPGYTYWTDFIFQAMFAATAATIVSGAVAERVNLKAFLIFSTIYVALVYPVLGSWKWGGGWLNEMGFYDFAGSTLVHSVGGWAALAGVILIGPRLGKYVNGEIRPIRGHNLPLAAIGMFLLWFGWYGFNGGSVLSADPGFVSLVFVTTSIAAASGVLGSMVTCWIVQKHPDVSMVMNGALAGLVGITAGADQMGMIDSVLIGLIAGVVVVFSVMLLDKWKLDDPVGAISVHLVCGIWGTLAVGIFAAENGFSIVTQLIGVLAYGAVAFPAAFLIFFVLKMIVGVRVSESEERRGLDLSEHNMEAYPDYQVLTYR